MQKTKEQITEKIAELGKLLETTFGPKRDVIDAVLDVLENELEEDEIEEKYYDGHETKRESSALLAYQWMNGEITDEEFYI